ncbi:MAG: hypothetical protein ACXW3N_06070 [Rhodoplanes sp.]|jgi:hypothetical protein
MERLRQHLRARNIEFSNLPDGDAFFRRSDGQGMYLRAYADGSYDWCVNAARNDTNLMDFRPRESHRLEEVIRRIDDFLDGTVWGSVILDTLGLVQPLMERGLSREDAEKAVEAARTFVLDMHKDGMDAGEIRNRFIEIHEQLRRERAARGEIALQASK